MARTIGVEKRLLRSVIKQALEQTDEFHRRNQRIEVSNHDDGLFGLQVKVFGEGNPLPATLTIKISGNI